MTEFKPTHAIKITNNDGTVSRRLVELIDGAAYTEAEAAAGDAADWEVVDGEWRFQGQAVPAGARSVEVVAIEKDEHGIYEETTMTNSGIPMTGGQRQTCRDADARAVGAAWGDADANADRPAKSDAEIIALAAQEVDGELGGWQEAAAIRGYRRAYASSEVR